MGSDSRMMYVSHWAKSFEIGDVRVPVLEEGSAMMLISLNLLTVKSALTEKRKARLRLPRLVECKWTQLSGLPLGVFTGRVCYRIP
jgi:hypothetical protein